MDADFVERVNKLERSFFAKKKERFDVGMEAKPRFEPWDIFSFHPISHYTPPFFNCFHKTLDHALVNLSRRTWRESPEWKE